MWDWTKGPLKSCPTAPCVIISVQSDHLPPWESITLHILSSCRALTQQWYSCRFGRVSRVLAWTFPFALPLGGLRSKIALQLRTQVRRILPTWSYPQLAVIWRGGLTCDDTCCFRSIPTCKFACSAFRKVITIIIKVGLILIYPKQVDTTEQSKMGWFRKVLMEFFTIFIEPASY